MTRTKIVCTIGPASRDPEMIDAMLKAGMDVARLNFSHGSPKQHIRDAHILRQKATALGHSLALLVDLCGPKIRVGRLEGGMVHLEKGAKITITTRDQLGTKDVIPTSYAHLPQDVKPGDRILLADGALELRVQETFGEDVACEVVVGGDLSEHKGMNLPGVALSAPSLTEKDLQDIDTGIKLGADYFAMSFVRSAEDIALLRSELRSRGVETPVIAKLERPQAIDHLDDILHATDAVMVARGDLGVEMSPEKVPVLQKRIIARCAEFAVPVITATQMLESMIEHPQPTRAEASDVANAIFDGTDAVMLSGETAVGRYPLEALQTMERIIVEAEAALLSQPPAAVRHLQAGDPVANAISHVACEAVEDVGATGIVALTRSGATARLISKYKPRVPTLALTWSPATCRRVALYWGVIPFLSQEFSSGDEMAWMVDWACASTDLIQIGDMVVVTSGTGVLDQSTTNALRLHRVQGPEPTPLDAKQLERAHQIIQELGTGE